MPHPCKSVIKYFSKYFYARDEKVALTQKFCAFPETSSHPLRPPPCHRPIRSRTAIRLQAIHVVRSPGYMKYAVSAHKKPWTRSQGRGSYSPASIRRSRFEFGPSDDRTRPESVLLDHPSNGAGAPRVFSAETMMLCELNGNHIRFNSTCF